ncbi:hypothetical protein POPTR_004G047932v4 [Populus trichocarpa]|uniref:Uncharacterized protein n=1 Tax=Populus trichocarpa TaxID=3694 RepID=A0ACC0T2X3_POPTR|nr:hypothetical protein POPTR_004G047932v4 [Populus trichocarpa]
MFLLNLLAIFPLISFTSELSGPVHTHGNYSVTWNSLFIFLLQYSPATHARYLLWKINGRVTKTSLGYFCRILLCGLLKGKP